jgi:hypothetical protein
MAKQLKCETGISIHPIFQKQQLFIEVIDGGCFTLLVLLHGHSSHRIY